MTTGTASVGRIAAVLVPGAVLALLSTTLVGVAVPRIAGEFTVPASAVQWVTTSFLLASAAAIPLAGWAGIRFGMRRTWLVAVAVFALGAAASALAPSLLALDATRALQGLGGGALEPLMLTAMATAAGPERMGRVMGSVAAAMSVGPLVGPAVGGAVLDLVGWRWVFGGSAIAAGLLFVASVLVLPRAEPARARLDLVGLLLLIAGAALILLGLGGAGTGGSPIAVAVAVVAGAGLLALFAVRSVRREGRAVVDLRVLGDRGVAPGILVMALVGGAIFPTFFALPQFLQGVLGLDPAGSGLLLVPFGLGTLLAMPVMGRVSDRVGARILAPLGAAVTTVGFLALQVVASAPLVAVAAFVAGVGLGSIGSPTVGAIYRAADPGRIPSASTILFMTNQLGGAVGVAVTALAIGSDRWTADVGAAPLWIPTIAVAVAGVIALRLRGAQPSTAQPSAATQPGAAAQPRAASTADRMSGASSADGSSTPTSVN